MEFQFLLVRLLGYLLLVILNPEHVSIPFGSIISLPKLPELLLIQYVSIPFGSIISINGCYAR